MLDSVYSNSTCAVLVIPNYKLLPHSLQKVSVSVFDDSLEKQVLRSVNLFKQSSDDCDEATTKKQEITMMARMVLILSESIV